eukprot:Pgem_evm1s14683
MGPDNVDQNYFMVCDLNSFDQYNLNENDQTKNRKSIDERINNTKGTSLKRGSLRKSIHQHQNYRKHSNCMVSSSHSNNNTNGNRTNNDIVNNTATALPMHNSGGIRNEINIDLWKNNRNSSIRESIRKNADRNSKILPSLPIFPVSVTNQPDFVDNNLKASNNNNKKEKERTVLESNRNSNIYVEDNSSNSNSNINSNSTSNSNSSSTSDNIYMDATNSTSGINIHNLNIMTNNQGVGSELNSAKVGDFINGNNGYNVNNDSNVKTSTNAEEDIDDNENNNNSTASTSTYSVDTINVNDSNDNICQGNSNTFHVSSINNNNNNIDVDINNNSNNNNNVDSERKNMTKRKDSALPNETLIRRKRTLEKNYKEHKGNLRGTGCILAISCILVPLFVFSIPMCCAHGVATMKSKRKLNHCNREIRNRNLNASTFIFSVNNDSNSNNNRNNTDSRRSREENLPSYNNNNNNNNNSENENDNNGLPKYYDVYHVGGVMGRDR